MRLFSFPTQRSSHSVVNLPIHLESMSMVTYRDQATTHQLQNLIRRGARTKLTAFSIYVHAIQKERKFYCTRIKRWAPYKKYVASLGRLVHVSPQDPERFYLRILLCHRRSPKTFEDIRTVNGVVHKTFHDALAARYLENDREWEECLAEAVSFKMPYALRQLFGTILVYLLPDNASALWDRFKKDFSEDYFKSIAERVRQNNIERDEEVRLRMAEYKCLKWVAEYLLSNEKTLDMYGLPELSTYQDISEEVEREDTHPRDVVASEIATYEPEDL
ncbi:Helitron helicase, partial [Phytophthora megakarya]